MSRQIDGKYAEEVLLMGYNCYMQQNFDDALRVYNAIDSIMGGLEKPYWLDIAKEFTTTLNPQIIFQCPIFAAL